MKLHTHTGMKKSVWITKYKFHKTILRLICMMYSHSPTTTPFYVNLFEKIQFKIYHIDVTAH